MTKTLRNIALLTTISYLLCSCAATSVAISKRNLDVQTKMSQTVFLPPVANSQKTVYVQIKNTTDKADFNIDGVRSRLQAKGYTITSNYNKAHYLLQVNVLQVGELSQAAAEKAKKLGFGGAANGAIAGAAAAAVIAPGSGRGMIGMGLVGGIASTVANAMVKDVVYTAITDVKITTRKAHSSAWGKAYTTRIVSTAEKANLKFSLAEPKLENGLEESISGIF